MADERAQRPTSGDAANALDALDAYPTPSRDQEVEWLERRLRAVTAWIEEHHPEAFREGLWDAVADMGPRPASPSHPARYGHPKTCRLPRGHKGPCSWDHRRLHWLKEQEEKTDGAP